LCSRTQNTNETTIYITANRHRDFCIVNNNCPEAGKQTNPKLQHLPAVRGGGIEMNQTNDGGPAFPQEICDWEYQSLKSPAFTDEQRQIVFDMKRGMSLRDWFAGQALAGMLANSTGNRKRNEEWWSLYAYKQADAMIAARNEEAAK
jgi:hypothetical protein